MPAPPVFDAYSRDDDIHYRDKSGRRPGRLTCECAVPGGLMDEIPDVALGEVVRRIVEAIHPERIPLFGSQVRCQPNAERDSDLLLVLGASSEPGYRRAREV